MSTLEDLDDGDGCCLILLEGAGDLRAEVDIDAGERGPYDAYGIECAAHVDGRRLDPSGHQVIDAIHGVAFESYERAIDTHVKNLRRKLEPEPRRLRYILTAYGVGYRFAAD